MEKLSLEKITDDVVVETFSASKIYMEEMKKTDMPKIMWAFLHIGYAAALRLHGYPEKFIEKALLSARDKIKEIYK